jgi:hypothetical protein
MLVKTFYHEGTPRANVVMQGTLMHLGSTIIIASRDNHRLDILANFRDEGGTFKADYNRIDLLVVSEEILDGSEPEILIQFEQKIEPDVLKAVMPWLTFEP